MKNYTDGSSMSHKDFKEYVKSYNSLFENEELSLKMFERDGNMLSLPFCICYKQLLKDRLRFCVVCADYLRSMAEKSFWFMKPLVLRRARKFESLHYEALGRLMQVNMYLKTIYDATEKADI